MSRASRASRALLAVAALAVGLLVPAAAAPAGAVFTATTANQTSLLSADVLDPPSGMTATRTCAYNPTTFVGSSQASGTGTSITVARPAGVVPGDVLVAVLGHANLAAVPAVSPVGSWHVSLGSPSASAGVSLFASKVVGAADPAELTFTGLADGIQTTVVVVAYRSVVLNYPSHGIQNGSGTVITAPSSRAAAGGVLITAFLAFGEPGQVPTPAGTTRRAAEVGNAKASPVSVMVADRQISVSTDMTGWTSATLTTPRANQGMSVALPPGPGPSPVTLSWTPTPDLHATGYEGYRSDVPGSTAIVGPRTLNGYSDASLGTGGATYHLRSVSGTWRSAWTSAQVPACP